MLITEWMSDDERGEFDAQLAPAIPLRGSTSSPHNGPPSIEEMQRRIAAAHARELSADDAETLQRRIAAAEAAGAGQ